MSFDLSKWYLDCVSDDGDVVIAYAAEVRWAALRLRYASTLVQRAGGETKVDATLRGAPPPEREADTVVWSAPALSSHARFTALAPPVSDTVLDRPEGSVAWTCHMPRARADFTLPDGPPIRGLGYVEHLSLTIAPWQLPIDELRWGRFLAEDASLVWIDWRGPHTRQVVILDGALQGPARIDERGLVADDGSLRLAFEAPRVLRHGALGTTALAILPAVETVLPVRILATDERKWVARGVLERAGRRSSGWVVHEVVRWP